MKKISMYLVASILVLSIIPTILKAGTESGPVSILATKPVESTEATVLLERLNEINTMDVTAMKSAEKKQLRKEVRSIKKSLNSLNDGVYLSVGAIIIIILLLILLL